MIRFEKLSATEKVYPFIDAVADADYKNGTFGTVEDGTFTAGKSFMAIMQVEKGDDMQTDDFLVRKYEHVRVADFSQEGGQIVNITADTLPDEYAVGDMLVAGDNGALAVDSAATGEAFEVVEVTKYGVRAAVVA